VIQRREQLCLATKPREAIFIGGPRSAQDLDGDVAIQFAVVGSIDVAHSAASELTDDAVMGDARSDCDGTAAVVRRMSCPFGGRIIARNLERSRLTLEEWIS
jgi:hypothetical protein